MRHLNDDLIQKFIDTPELTDRTLIESHLKICFECQDKLGQYRNLYQHLAVESEIVPDNFLNIGVLAAIEQIESKSKSRQLVQIAGSFSGVMLLALSLGYFGLVSWQGLLSKVNSTLTNVFSPFYETVGLLAGKLNGNLELLAFAGLVLLLFQLLDHGLLKRKATRT